MLGESIGCTALVTWLVVNLIVVVCQQLQPVHLPSIENTRFCKVFEVLVVSENLDQEFCSFEPVSPILKSLHDCEGLLIRYTVVVFSWVHRFQHETRSDGVNYPLVSGTRQLHKHNLKHWFPFRTVNLDWHV